MRIKLLGLYRQDFAANALPRQEATHLKSPLGRTSPRLQVECVVDIKYPQGHAAFGSCLR